MKMGRNAAPMSTLSQSTGGFANSKAIITRRPAPNNARTTAAGTLSLSTSATYHRWAAKSPGPCAIRGSGAVSPQD